jgi:ketosteroid isomerase-like protein
MSEENVEIIRSIYRLWAEKASARHLIDPQLEYVNPTYALESGTRHDRRALASIRDVYPDFRVEPERFLDAGEDVVVIGVARGTSASGLEAQWRQGYVWTVRDGRAVRFRWFNDPREALAHVGLGGGEEQG